MSDGNELDWAHIEGYPYARGYSGSEFYSGIQYNYEWGRFSSKVAGELRHYRVPNYNDFNALMKNCEYGVGVMYGDGSSLFQQ